MTTGQAQRTRPARSPGRRAWQRLRADRTAMIAGTVTAALIIVALAAPLVEMLYGIGPSEQFQAQLDASGLPIGPAGGISAQHWFGLEPGLGRDIFIRLVYGLRIQAHTRLCGKHAGRFR